jgi:hypothetical protein
VLNRDPYARIVVAGDFNQHLPLWKQRINEGGLPQAVKDGVPTRLGGSVESQLDQVFTNLEAVSCQVGDFDNMVSDHRPILVELILIAKDQEARISEGLRRITESAIKKAALSERSMKILESV